MSFILTFFLSINILTFIIYGIDKRRAQKGRWRIPESTLMILAILGGSIGALLGIKIWRHKTMHKKFKYGIPTILILQTAALLYYFSE